MSVVQTRNARRCVFAHNMVVSMANRLIGEVDFGIGLSSPMCSVERPRVSSDRLNAVIRLPLTIRFEPAIGNFARVIALGDSGCPPRATLPGSSSATIADYLHRKAAISRSIPAAFIFPTKMVFFWIRTPGRNRAADVGQVRGLTFTSLPHRSAFHRRDRKR
jgi:hypothetical protein